MNTQDILKEYENTVPLKVGGQKEVYRGFHRSYGDVVIKIAEPSSPDSLERLHREVMLLNEMDSDYYPKQLSFNVLPNSKVVIVEEYVESRPLSKCLGEFSDLKETLMLLKQLVSGLLLLWNRRIVHRDLKPDNILITPSKKPKIIDLGIARILDMESLTKTYAISGPGTSNYAAPEQFSNRKTEINHRTDQFVLGIVFVQLLLEGVHPFSPDLVGGKSIPHNIIEDNWPKGIFQQDKFQLVGSLATRLLGHEPYQRFRTPDLLVEEIEICIGRLL